MLHNPSVAGHIKDDPTSRRGIGFARAWGGSRLIFINVWAGVATKPRDLWAMSDPVGPENDRHITEAVAEIVASGGFLVLAFGRISPPARIREAAQFRLVHLHKLIIAMSCDVRVLDANADGSPKHPLYVR